MSFAGFSRLIAPCAVVLFRLHSPAISAPTAPSPTPNPETVKQQALDGTGNILEVPFVATPSKVVDELVEMAELRDGDVVYDLGCGDGRIVFAALRSPGVRAIGYDLDPRRIEECLQTSADLGVSSRSEFVQEDIFNADLSLATVVTLYLVPKVNNRLLPKLLRELRPGTRILSHNYGFDAWRPDKIESVEVTGIGKDYSGIHTINYWTVPEDASALISAAESALLSEKERK
jgi:SAM-dependent methyltransferase